MRERRGFQQGDEEHGEVARDRVSSPFRIQYWKLTRRWIGTSLPILRNSLLNKTPFLNAILAICLTASSCKGQQGNEVDPALIAAADSLMPQLELISGLHKLRPITMRQQSREELRKYVEERLRTEMPPEEMKGMQAAYAALGLISDTLNLEKLLLDLYAEQV